MDIYDLAEAYGKKVGEELIRQIDGIESQEDLDAHSDGFWDGLMGALEQGIRTEDLQDGVCRCE